MKIIATILAFTLMMIIQPLFGQDSSSQIIKQGKDQYEYQDKIYNKHQLDFIFLEDLALTESYTKAMHRHKVAKRLGYGTLGLLGFGVVAIAIPNPNWNCDNCIPTLDVIGALSILVVPITGSIATLKHLQYKGGLAKTIDGFNASQLDEYGRQIEQPSIGLSSRGLGLSISF